MRLALLPLLAVAATLASAAAPAPAPVRAPRATAVFAGGCFWSTESDLDRVPGVVATTSGFTGGRVANPSYKQVSAGGTGHLEAVKVVYDPRRVSYPQLVDAFYRTIDPADAGGTFCDRGEEYGTAVFPANAAERQAALAAQARIVKSGVLKGRPIATRIRDAAPFYAAETYHQDYYRKAAVHYKMYRIGCGRDARLRAIWGRAPGDRTA